MSYLELSLKINNPAIDVASDFLISELGFSGVVTEDVFINRKNTIGVIKAYVENTDLIFSIDEMQQKLSEKRALLKDLGLSDEDLGDWSCSFSYFADESWAEKWKDYWDVQKIGERTVICPSWLEYTPIGDEIKIQIDPGSAFGTGTHPTTRLCIRDLEKYVKPDSTVVDVGCGSGILSISAKKLGAKEVFGVDTDPDSVRVSEENAKINLTECLFAKGSASDVTCSYDIVVANILAHVIVDIMADLKRIANPSGVIILSGIIEEKAQDVLNAMQENGIEFISQIIEEGNGENWVCITGKNNT